MSAMSQFQQPSVPANRDDIICVDDAELEIGLGRLRMRAGRVGIKGHRAVFALVLLGGIVCVVGLLRGCSPAPAPEHFPAPAPQLTQGARGTDLTGRP